MVYGRRRYRRKSYRTRRTLSTRNIFNNKSARAQASQISTLRKRINYVYKQCKPEIKIIESNPTTLTLLSNPTTGTPYHLYSIEMPELGIEDNARIGNVCNIMDSHIFMNMRLAYQGDVNYNLNGIGQTVNTTVRIIPFLLKAGTDTTPDPNEILNMTTITANPSTYRLNPISPFNEGVSSRFQILGDYRYTLRFDDKSLINSKIKIKGSRIKKYIDTSYNTYGKAAIFVLITWNGLDPITYQTELIATPVCYITISDKTAYTDP